MQNVFISTDFTAYTPNCYIHVIIMYIKHAYIKNNSTFYGLFSSLLWVIKLYLNPFFLKVYWLHLKKNKNTEHKKQTSGASVFIVIYLFIHLFYYYYFWHQHWVWWVEVANRWPENVAFSKENGLRAGMGEGEQKFFCAVL